MNHQENTKPGFSFSDNTTAKAPLRVWLALVLGVAAGVAAWSTTRGDVTSQGARINALEMDSRATREVLIRIDERTAEIKRRLDQPTR